MSLIDIIKPLLSIALSSSAVNEPWQHPIFFWKHQESNPVPTGWEAQMLPTSMLYRPPSISMFAFNLKHYSQLHQSHIQTDTFRHFFLVNMSSRSFNALISILRSIILFPDPGTIYFDYLYNSHL